MLRRYTFKLYPNAAQEAAMREQARLCAVLWNALLEMRETYAVNKETGSRVFFDRKVIDRQAIDQKLNAIYSKYDDAPKDEKGRVKYSREDLKAISEQEKALREKENELRKKLNVRALSAFDQGKDLTAMNADPDCAEFKALGRGTQERVADMLDLAMKAFFKRAKAGAGAASGYPRYKSTRHAENIPLREPVKSGWKFEPKGKDGGCHSADFSERGKREISSKKGGCNQSGAASLHSKGGDRSNGNLMACGEGAASLHSEGGDRSASSASRSRQGAATLHSRGGDRVGIFETAKPSGAATPQSNHWRLTLRGVPGTIKARGKFPADPESLKTADVKFYDGAWWFSVCVDVPARMVAGKNKLTVEFDLIDSFASVKSADGRCAPGLSDPFYSGRKGEFPNISRAVGDSPCGEPSNEGEAQAACHAVRRHWTCGEPSNEGEAQARECTPSEGPLACGEPANAGKAQGDGRRLGAGSPCGNPSNEGESHVNGFPCPTCGPCGEPANVGEAQVAACPVDAIQSERDRRYKRGSIRWRREKQRIARIKAKQARRTKETLHKWTTAIVREAAELAIIAPPVKDMTKTGRGNEKAHGAEVKTIAMLNRHVLSMAPASAVQMLEYKAAEAGIACAVERRQDHQIRIGGDLREAAVTAKKARRVVKREAKKLLEAAE